MRWSPRFKMPLLMTVVAGASVLAFGVAPDPASAATKTVNMVGTSFSPASITVNVGDTVKWVHDSNPFPHSVTADNGSFDSSPSCPPTCLNSGSTYSRVFTTAGTFAYHCKIHGASGGIGMSGVVIVSGGGGGVTVTAVTPSGRGQGATALPLKLTGSGFKAGAKVTVSGAGVTVASPAVAATTINAKITVAPTATVGARDVIVTNTDHSTGTCKHCLTVTRSPAVSALAPNSIVRGTANVTVKVTGSGFATGLKSAKFSGAGITVSLVARVDATHVTIKLSVAASAAKGARALTLANPDGGTTTKAAALTIK